MSFNIPKLQYNTTNRFTLIAGPCAIENEETPLCIAEKLKQLSDKYEIPLVFKGSFKKANRSRIDSFSGIGDEKALRILEKVKKELGLLLTTDIHEPQQAQWAAEVVDVLQIPAFLVRQTDLVVAAAKTGKFVTLKKGQFLSPESMEFPVQKCVDSGNSNVAIIERGTTFGYGDLVVDFRGVPTMQKHAPVILDVTHSLQQPNQSSGVTGGRPDMIETIAKAGIAAGVNGLFIETHPDPKNAKSDGANMLQLDQLDGLLHKLIKLQDALL